jgi:hypothetical protein
MTDKPLRASELEEDSGYNFELDLRGFDETTPPAPEVEPSDEDDPVPTVRPDERLWGLLAPYSGESTDKARKLLTGKKIQEVKSEGSQTWYNVQGSTLYVVKISRGEDFLYAECSCPNGTHRGGDAICYHSIAARVMDAELVETWIGTP